MRWGFLFLVLPPATVACRADCPAEPQEQLLLRWNEYVWMEVVVCMACKRKREEIDLYHTSGGNDAKQLTKATAKN